MVLRKPYALFILLGLASSAFVIAVSPIPSHHLKRMKRGAKKTFAPLEVQFNEHQSLFDSSQYGEGYAMQLLLADSTVGTIHYRKANACNFGGCIDTICKDPAVGFKELIYYYLIEDANHTIQRIQVLEYESQYGYEITSKGWLKQFKGKTSGEFKLNENVDGISGATVSVKAMINDINSLRD